MRATESQISRTRSISLALKTHIQTLLKEGGESCPAAEELPLRREEDSDSLLLSTAVAAEFTPLSVPPYHRLRAQRTVPDLKKACQER